MTPLSGRFYRIVFATDIHRVLEGVPSPEGRFHHSGQPALYLSPDPETAGGAIDSYFRTDDPPRLILPLQVVNAQVLDFRQPGTSVDLGLTGSETTVNWRDQRSNGQLASSWRASDEARAAGADGMIYHSRKHPPRWHLVLFRWNQENAPELRQNGQPLAFIRHH